MAPSSTEWIIVWTDEDESYSLVNVKDVVTDIEILGVNDKVNFFYGREDAWEGQVTEIGGKTLLCSFHILPVSIVGAA